MLQNAVIFTCYRHPVDNGPARAAVEGDNSGPETAKTDNGRGGGDALAAAVRALSTEILRWLEPRLSAGAERFENGSEAGWRPVREGGVDVPLTVDRLAEARRLGQALGCYFAEPGDDTIKFAVVDVDDHTGELEWAELVERVRPLVDELKRQRLFSFVVRSGGGHGLHLYVVWAQRQPTRRVRRALAHAVAAAGLKVGGDGLAQGTVEIFPKTDVVPEGGYGSLIAWPYMRASVPVDPDTLLPDEHFRFADLAHRPMRCARRLTTDDDFGPETDGGRRSGPPRLREKFHEGRDGALFSLGYLLSAAGLGEDRVLALVSAVDAAAPAALHENFHTGGPLQREGDLRKFLRMWSRYAPPEDRREPGQHWLLHTLQVARRCGLGDDQPPTVATVAGVLNDAARQLDGGALDDDDLRRFVERSATLSEDFTRDNKGIPHKNAPNVRLALQKLGVSVSYDKFADRMLVEGLEDHGPALDDAAMKRLWLDVDERFHFRPAKDFFWTVVEDTARRNGFHPVLNYLNGLTWDGTPRLDRWLCTYANAEDTAYVRAVASIVLIAAVRRVRQPGCRFDEMLVLEGPQGTIKSTALQVLAVRDEWFSDDLPLNADGKRVIEALAGRWLVEAAELKGMRKADVEHLKALLSRRRDRARMSYDRLVSEVPRQCVIVGTTNSTNYLRDNTGNRRFWPVQIERFDLDTLKRDRDQLWAEAAYREARGESIELDPQLYDEAARVQESRRAMDPWLETLRAALPDGDCKVTAEDLWSCLNVPTERRTQNENVRLGDCMRELGFERRRLRADGHRHYCYVRGNTDPQNLTWLWRPDEPSHQDDDSLPF